MPRATVNNFAERERDALLIATASDADVLQLCRSLGDDPDWVAAKTRRLLSEATFAESKDCRIERLPLPTSGALPLHRVLLVSDNPETLVRRATEFRRHQFSLGVIVSTATSAMEAIGKLEEERFEGVLIELTSASQEDLRAIERLRRWSTPLPPILLNSDGMTVLEMRKLDREAVRAIAVGLRKAPPRPYRKGPGRAPVKRENQDRMKFDEGGGEKTG